MSSSTPIVVPGPNHVLHIALCVATGGLWLFVYIPILARAGRRQKRATRNR